MTRSSGSLGLECASHLATVHVGHAEVDHGHVGVDVARHGDALATRGGDARDSQTGVGSDDRGQAVGHHLVVVDDQYPYEPSSWHEARRYWSVGGEERARTRKTAGQAGGLQRVEGCVR